MLVSCKTSCHSFSVEVWGIPELTGAGVSYEIYNSVVEHCCKRLTLNELREVDRQMDTYSVLPVEIQTIARQIKETLAKREKDSAPKLTVRYERGNLSGLKITFADRREGYIYKNREPRVADFSTKELREIVRQFKSKILAMSAEDITPNQRELLVGLEKALSERPTEKPNVTPTASSVCKNLRAIMNRNSHSDANVVVTLPGDQCEKITIYQGIVEHCCKDLSNNELREVVRQIRNQIVAMSEDDIPVTWIEALTEFEETLKVREQ